MVVATVLVVWLLVRDGGDDGTGTEDAVTIAGVEAGATDETGECPPEDGAAERVTTFAGAWLDGLPTCIEDGASYTATIALSNDSSITVELDAAAAPEAVNAFVVLARYGYYDGVPAFLTNNRQGIVRFGHPDTSDVGAPGVGIGAGENPDAELGPDSVILAVDANGAVGASLDIIGSETQDYVSNGTVIGTLDSESRPPIDDVLAEHVPGETVLEIDEGIGTPATAINIESITITQG